MAAAPARAFNVQPPRCRTSLITAATHAASRRLPTGRTDFSRFEGLRAQVSLRCSLFRGLSAPVIYPKYQSHHFNANFWTEDGASTTRTLIHQK